MKSRNSIIVSSKNGCVIPRRKPASVASSKKDEYNLPSKPPKPKK